MSSHERVTCTSRFLIGVTKIVIENSKRNSVKIPGI
jgi:hypothetical protein